MQGLVRGGGRIGGLRPNWGTRVSQVQIHQTHQACGKRGSAILHLCSGARLGQGSEARWGPGCPQSAESTKPFRPQGGEVQHNLWFRSGEATGQPPGKAAHYTFAVDGSVEDEGPTPTRQYLVPPHPHWDTMDARGMRDADPVAGEGAPDVLHGKARQTEKRHGAGPGSAGGTCRVVKVAECGRLG